MLCVTKSGKIFLDRQRFMIDHLFESHWLKWLQQNSRADKWQNQGASDFADWFIRHKSRLSRYWHEINIFSCFSYFKEASRAAWEKAGLKGRHWQQAYKRMNREIKAIQDEVSFRNVEDAVSTVHKLVFQKEDEERKAPRGIEQYRLMPSLRRFFVMKKLF